MSDTPDPPDGQLIRAALDYAEEVNRRFVSEPALKDALGNLRRAALDYAYSFGDPRDE